MSKPVLLNEYEDAGIAELEFTDRKGMIQFFYVNPDLICVA